MGEQKVSLVTNQVEMQNFMKALLNDVQALEHMLENDWFESGVVRIGAEQEMALVHKNTYKPYCISVQALEKLKDHDWVETELAQFNLETNLTPRTLAGSCFSEMQVENQNKLDIISKVLDELDSKLILTGVVPTLRKFDLVMENLSPQKRYKALMEALNRQQLGTAYELHLDGIDELKLKHDSPLLEACNTSFQVHLQVHPSDFVKIYNISQALAGPTMAIAANSPIVFGKRLWHESRIVLFQQALDTRSSHDHFRERKPRVSFGSDWLSNSILDIYKEDISRFRVLISGDQKEDALALVKKGEVPKLRALQVHNSTVYRWNRPCYGISANGQPHLRIENRVLPSGPTVLDEMANACFWLGAVTGMAEEVEDVRNHLTFADVRDNFVKAAKIGIDSKFNWYNDQKVSACDLVLNTLLPMAENGLRKHKVDEKDIGTYLGIIEERAKKHMNGARWALRAYTKLLGETTMDEALTVLTAATIENQNKADHPVHNWELPELMDLKEYKPSNITVSEFMNTDLYTVQKDDIIELVADIMDWRKIRYTPVEDEKGNLIGLITMRKLMRYALKSKSENPEHIMKVSDIMIKDLISIGQDASIVDAMHLMRKNKIGCLPVVKGKELIGIITEADFLRISGRLIERLK